MEEVEEVLVEELVLIPEEQDVYWQEVELSTLSEDELNLPEVIKGRKSVDDLYRICVPTKPLLGTAMTLKTVRVLVNTDRYKTTEQIEE